MKIILLITSLFFVNNVLAQLPTTGLLAYYSFCGNSNDMSGHGHTLKVSGGATLCNDRNGKANSAYHFDGINSMLYNDTVFSLTGDFSYSFWMSGDTIQDAVLLFNGNGGFNGVGVSFNDGAAVPGTKITLQAGNVCYCIAVPTTRYKWHHIVTTRSSSTFKLYIDTVLAGTTTLTPVAAVGKFAIGLDYSDGSNPLLGEMDDVAIYNRALTAADIRALFLGCGYQITTQPATTTATVGNNTTFTVTTTMSSPAYQWQVDAGTGFTNLTNSGPYSGVNTNSLLVTGVSMTLNNYNYRCVIGGTFCCTDTSTAAKLTVFPVSVNNVMLSEDINVYPNPAHGVFSVEVNHLRNNTSYTIEIANMVGQKIYSAGVIDNKTEIKIETTGLYFVRLVDNENKIVVIKKISID